MGEHVLGVMCDGLIEREKGVLLTCNVSGASSTSSSHRNTTIVAAISTRAVVGAPRSQQAYAWRQPTKAKVLGKVRVM